MNKFEKVREIINNRNKYANRKSKSGFKGVHLRSNGRYESYFKISDGIVNMKFNLGYYNTAEEANRARLIFIDSLK